MAERVSGSATLASAGAALTSGALPSGVPARVAAAGTVIAVSTATAGVGTSAVAADDVVHGAVSAPAAVLVSRWAAMTMRDTRRISRAV